MTTESLSLPGWDRKHLLRLQRSLQDWFCTQGRDLPWRHTQDPYAIWVSEVMLQQTQVATVIPYFQRWMQALPRISDLAAAPQHQVLKLWEGMGYYRRALNLRRAAQILMREQNGEFPRDLNRVLALPGIGRTTAGGILSAAFNQPVPILDGNVKRVLARLVALQHPPAQCLPLLWQLSEQVLDPVQPRNFNQALMDLGATVCRPKQPRCGECPWQADCSAYNRGQHHQLPMSVPRATRPHKQIAVAIVLRGKEILIDQRLETSMLSGLWEFPGGKIEPGETAAECVVREVKEEIGIDIEVVTELATIEHAYTHFTITLIAFICRYLGGEAQALQCTEVRWVSPAALSEFPFPGANQKLFPYLHAWLAEQRETWDAE
ncbi:A/G-specific adenine glycosylase [Synechococcus sp. Nb3U1]|uniref:A/G-specific adenine glycosylase n=1 Tax=Synechococcus sp. Nb3U1 TaxID=1914529 RepID=UPI001F1F6466|nr:A/G-specific adenine glycosylase [Synechococcus sp. Nb3U1]MCF2971127.1 A/G-specific adenine glycosylase [Synechococcus sp. Nb3U1]